MGTIYWILLFIIHSFILKWVISWGGAKAVVNSFFINEIFFGSLSTNLNEEQFKFYALIIWLLLTIWFLFGLFIPNIRYFHFLF